MFSRRLFTRTCLTAMPIVLGCSAPAWAQDASTAPASAAPAEAAAPELDPAIEFSSDALEYDQARDVVTASGRHHDLLRSHPAYRDVVLRGEW